VSKELLKQRMQVSPESLAAQDGPQNQIESRPRTEQSEVAKLPTNATGTRLMNP
jgi:hypothetical protein